MMYGVASHNNLYVVIDSAIRTFPDGHVEYGLQATGI